MKIRTSDRLCIECGKRISAAESSKYGRKCDTCYKELNSEQSK